MTDERNNDILPVKISGISGPVTGWLDGHTILLGLFADPIRHSVSPTMHNNAMAKLGLNGAYLCFEIGLDRIEDAVKALRTLDMRGANVSMPNKQAIIPYLDKLDPAAEICGAVNTVVNDHGFLTGYTTDGTGWLRSLKEDGQDVKGQVMTLAGAGGAAIPIAVAAAMGGAKEIRIFNIHDRNWEPAKDKVAAINEATDCVCSLNPMEDKEAFKQSIAESGIYCDATGVGMPPLDDLSLVEAPSWLHEDMVVSDTVYEPRETKLMRIAKEARVKHIYNGLGMVVGQGAESFKLWTGKEMPVDYIKEIVAKA